MIVQILKDPWTYACTLGMAFIQWMMANTNALMGVIVFAGGVATFIFGIAEKRRKNRILDVELQIKQEQLRQLKEDHELDD